ncbi:MAG TPA: ATP-binding protein [Candidatus Saccharimonadales bacterium]|nr:ATP-binding protein [Candidatus Saccharimonadales bacterium]
MSSSPTRLYLMVGYPGAGKTTAARWIAERTGAVHLWADVERNKLFDRPTHSQAESNQLYERLNEQTEQLLANGRSVVFDTNFNHYADRQLLRGIAARYKAETLVVWVCTPAAIARERAVHSRVVRNGYDFAMTGQQFDAIANKLEPPRKNEKIIKIDGTKLDAAAVMRLIDT